jgi:hypothetical protein
MDVQFSARMVSGDSVLTVNRSHDDSAASSSAADAAVADCFFNVIVPTLVVGRLFSRVLPLLLAAAAAIAAVPLLMLLLLLLLVLPLLPPSLRDMLLPTDSIDWYFFATLVSNEQRGRR